MSRPLRVDEAGLYYHVMNRGIAKQQIFYSDDDYDLFITILFEVCPAYNIVLHAFSLMPNHFHLFLHTTEANLSRFMQRLQSTFAICYNIKHKRVGPLFQGRFKSQVVDSTAYACVLSRYIHLNPVNTSQHAGCSLEEKAELLRNCPWSSLFYYCNPTVAADIPWLDPQEILSHFGSNPEEQIRNYTQYLDQGLASSPDDIRNAVFGEVVEQSIIGSGAFVETIKNILHNAHSTHPIARKIMAIPLETLETSLLSIPGIGYDDLHARGRGKTALRDTTLFLASLVSVSKVSLTEIGRYYGGLTVSSVSRIIRTVKKRAVADGSFRNLLLCLEECLQANSYDRITSLDISCIRNAYG